MSMSNYKAIVTMREAMFDGINFKNWCKDYKIKRSDITMYRELWNVANTTVTSSENWRKVILDSKVIPAFNNLLQCLDDYYQEGFGTFELDDILNVSKSTIQELLYQVEG